MTKCASTRIKFSTGKINTGLAILLATTALSLPAYAQVVDEIIVTATKRAEKLTEVPIAISVIGAADIDQTGIRELSQIDEYVPNVQIWANRRQIFVLSSPYAVFGVK